MRETRYLYHLATVSWVVRLWNVNHMMEVYVVPVNNVTMMWENALGNWRDYHPRTVISNDCYLVVAEL